jgi:2-deoxy-D-gluconate 3-dehydrogenase
MILDQFKLNGKVALVTGAGRGLGQAAAVGFAEAGADVAVADVIGTDETAARIKALGRRVCQVSANLLERSSVQAIVESTVRELGRIDILLNNAGIIRRAPAKDYTEDDWDATLEIDVNAAFILSQAAGRIMLKNGRGKIINVASVIAFQGGLNVAAYSVAKHGIAGLTKALANDWAKHGINVNALAPGFFATELTESLQKDPVRSRSITARIPAGRWGTPEDMAGAVVFLASAAADFVHGVVLPVDGGWMAW